MAPIVLTRFNCVTADAWNGVHNLNTANLKIALTNTAPVATNSILADIVQIAAGGGYTTGGLAVVTTSSSQTGGLYKLILETFTFTATGDVDPFRYCVLYNESSALDSLLGWYDFGSVINMTLDDGLKFTFGASNPALTNNLAP
mgnify:CR=1 FL=1